MTTLKLSGGMVQIPINKPKAVTVQKIQRNGFEVKVRFIDLAGTIVKSFVADNGHVDGMIQVYASQYNYKIVD